MSWLDVVPQILVIGLANGMVIALIALGYTMVYGIIELINFAHGDLLMLGCFCALTGVAMAGLPVTPGSTHAWIAIAALLIIVPAFCAALNGAVERIVYRPIRRGPKLTALVSAIGVSFIFINLGLFWSGLPQWLPAEWLAMLGINPAPFGSSAAGFKSFPALLPPGNLLPAGSAVMIGAAEVMVFLVTLPLLAGLSWMIQRTRLGRAMRATAQDPIAARLMGIDVDRVIGQTFIIGGALAGVGAVLFCLRGDAIHFQFTGFRAGMDAFTAAVLGGIGSLPGAVIGALCIGLVRAANDILGSGQWTNAVVFAVLILLLVFRPGGLLGRSTREKV